MEELNEIFESDLPEVEKLAQAFDRITSRYIEQAQQEIELTRAMQDKQAFVKEQIKLGMWLSGSSRGRFIKRSIFATNCTNFH